MKFIFFRLYSYTAVIKRLFSPTSFCRQRQWRGVLARRVINEPSELEKVDDVRDLDELLPLCIL